MFTSVTVENFMRIDDPATLALGPVTILVGGNGAGKSSILKGIHWAIRCASLRDSDGRVTLERMDYAPSRDFLHLAHKVRLNSEGASRKICVKLATTATNLTIEMNSTRNDAGIKVQVRGPFPVGADVHQSAYIPGLAGLSEAESLLATPILHRKAASGEGGSVLRHILLGLAIKSAGKESIEEPFELKELGSWVGRVFPGARFWVKYDRLRDVYIDSKFLTQDMEEKGKSVVRVRKSLEMAGTGFLQVVQIFAYLLHFKPRLLLIDEPDAHLHPSTQERLISAIESASGEFPETQFILTTHSPSMVRAATSISIIAWMPDGQTRPDTDDQVRRRMGWGALDKDIMLVTEDANLKYLKSILGQWPDIARKVLLWPTFGSGSLPKGQAVKKFRDELGIPIIVHRDRDFMSDQDLAALMRKMEYDIHSVPFWTPKSSDIEDEFCTPDHLKAVFSLTDQEVDDVFNAALASFDKDLVSKDFGNAYSSAIGGLKGPDIGSPIKRWNDLGGFGLKTIKGKELLTAITTALVNKFKDTDSASKLGKIDRLSTPTSPMHGDLKDLLEVEIEKVKPKNKQ